MSKTNLRGLLYSLLIGAFMAAGVLIAAPQAKADPEQDYVYFSLLEGNGMSVTSPAAAKATAAAICNALSSGTDWRMVITELMNGGDWDVDSATTVFAAAVIAYCPQLEPDFDGNIT
jgi:hypothetical protein